MANGIHYRIAVLGGGAAGLSVAAGLLHAGCKNIAIIEPSDKHYYQPSWTLVGGGIVKREESVRPMAGLIPNGAEWIQDAVTEIDPLQNLLKTRDGKEIGYEFLVVAPGLQIDWHRIKGLPETLGKNGMCSNYSFDTVNSTWENIKNFKGGNAVFNFPPPPIKCAGAPQKIMYLAEDYFRRQGIRD